MRRGFRSSWLVVAIVLATALAAPGTALAGTAETEVGGRGSQQLGFKIAPYTVFSSDSARRGHFDAYVRTGLPTGDMKLNANRSQAFTGGIDPATGSDAIFQQVKRGRSDLYGADLTTGHRTPLDDLNTARWEWSPRISASRILFTRTSFRRGYRYDAVMLYDRADQSTVKLHTYRSDGSAFVWTTFVGDAWAAWTRCDPDTCRVFVHDIDANATSKVPTVRRRPQYEATIDEADGLVYFVRSGRGGCGNNVRILSVPVTSVTDAPTVKASVGDGFDVSFGMSLAAGTTSDDLLFTRIDCDTLRTHVMAFRNLTP